MLTRVALAKTRLIIRRLHRLRRFRVRLQSGDETKDAVCLGRSEQSPLFQSHGPNLKPKSA